ncbi:hypothetical protein NDU88_002867 [Pleurodeles waltl]|uniref:Uncharacterized protein n=1 Tax=Pleurodeles waltl TaxID=8319 RepID=A0AAV7QB87_PLEWA|nr:hypothetical protein NDU88_002867 [Pleurodeles waltl]
MGVSRCLNDKSGGIARAISVAELSFSQVSGISSLVFRVALPRMFYSERRLTRPSVAQSPHSDCIPERIPV